MTRIRANGAAAMHYMMNREEKIINRIDNKNNRIKRSTHVEQAKQTKANIRRAVTNNIRSVHYTADGERSRERLQRVSILV